MLSPPRFRGLQKISDLPLISCDKNVNNQDSAKADKQRKQCPISFISKTERPCPKRLDWWRYLFNSLPRIRQKLHWWNETHICFATRIKNTRKHKSALAERSCPGKLLAVRLIVLATALDLKKKTYMYMVCDSPNFSSFVIFDVQWLNEEGHVWLPTLSE